MSCGHFHASYLWRDAATCEFSDLLFARGQGLVDLEFEALVRFD